MADTLTSNPIQIDLTVMTSRTIRIPRCRVLRVLLDGTKPASASNMKLRADSTSGPIFWRHSNPSVTADTHHEYDETGVWTEGVFFDGSGLVAWAAGSVLLVYLE